MALALTHRVCSQLHRAARHYTRSASDMPSCSLVSIVCLCTFASTSQACRVASQANAHGGGWRSGSERDAATAATQARCRVARGTALRASRVLYRCVLESTRGTCLWSTDCDCARPSLDNGAMIAWCALERLGRQVPFDQPDSIDRRPRWPLDPNKDATWQWIEKERRQPTNNSKDTSQQVIK